MRHAWLRNDRAFRPAGEDDGGGLSADPPSPSAGGGTDDQDPAGDDVIRDPEKKRRSDEAAAHRMKAKEATARAETAEAALAELRKHNAFLVAAAGRVTDLEAAWKLANHDSLTITNEGTVTGCDEMIATTLERYPYLIPADTTPDPFQPVPTQPSGRPLNGRKTAAPQTTTAQLEARFPALRHRN